MKKDIESSSGQPLTDRSERLSADFSAMHSGEVSSRLGYRRFARPVAAVAVAAVFGAGYGLGKGVTERQQTIATAGYDDSTPGQPEPNTEHDPADSEQENQRKLEQSMEQVFSFARDNGFVSQELEHGGEPSGSFSFGYELDGGLTVVFGNITVKESTTGDFLIQSNDIISFDVEMVTEVISEQPSSPGANEDSLNFEEAITRIRIDRNETGVLSAVANITDDDPSQLSSVSSNYVQRIIDIYTTPMKDLPPPEQDNQLPPDRPGGEQEGTFTI